MKFFRLRFVGAFLFALLSLGQAYPFSVAWASQGAHHTCCCAAMKEGESGCLCRHGGKRKCHKETTPGYAQAPCGGGATDVRSLNFSGEPCLPRFPSLAFVHEASFLFSMGSLAPPQFATLPNAPPPRVDS